jgi:hypothetical protein
MKIFNFQFSIFNLAGLACFLFIGCAVPRYEEPQLCPNKGTAAEVIAAMRDKQAAALSLVGTADCMLEFPGSDGKLKKESFGGKLFFVDPESLLIAGEKFGPIRIGVNPGEFWMYLKPAVDTAWYGLRKDTLKCGEKSGFNPASMVYLTEAFGRIELNAEWKFTADPGYDVLETATDGGIKRVFVNCCTSRIERIEYCELSGNLVTLAASADLADYQAIDGVGEIPTTIQLRHFRFGQSDMMFQLKLSGVKKFVPTPIQQEKLFVRPEAKGYEKVYRLNEQCDFVRE